MNFKSLLSLSVFLLSGVQSANAVEVVSVFAGEIDCVTVQSAQALLDTGLMDAKALGDDGNRFAAKAVINVDGTNYVNPVSLYREIAKGVLIPSLSSVAGTEVPADGYGADLLPFVKGQVDVTLTTAGICEFLPDGQTKPTEGQIVEAIKKVMEKVLRKFIS